MNLTPLYNKVLVELIDESEEVTAGSIILVQQEQPYVKGIVRAIGRGSYQNATRIAMDISVNDTVLFMRNTGMPVEYSATRTPVKVILSDGEIFAVIQPE